ncbi:hypothetical protein SAMN05444410_10913 [Hydrobacter penzbergensis]|uniref:Uncharacterized protein n=1 Tax=Hydrobacter penzbergensis TaxID=1235997 RepID=A0A8X8LE18_9BACT|nr:hypothetical protein [Hydrobacter penzbergensis]SDX09241.1 hypothetical protein SAMN05444410_10913 [Hydrobacter penzbergensis]
MPTFVLHRIGELEGIHPVFKLEKDGYIYFDVFEKKIKKDRSVSGQLNSIQAILYRIINDFPVPETKFKRLKGSVGLSDEYEIKTKDLRVYIFREKQTGNIIVWGGRKSTQVDDIRQFRRIKQLYLNAK